MGNLCVFTPLLGAVSETFIGQHCMEILPEKTVVLYSKKCEPAFWKVSGPAQSVGTIKKDPISLASKLIARVRIFSFPDYRNRYYLRLNYASRKAVKEFLIRHKVSVILGEYLDQSLFLIDIAKELGIKFFGHAHGYDISWALKDKVIEKEYLRYNGTSGIITMSDYSKNKLINLGIRPDKIYKIPYGIKSDAAYLKRENKAQVNCLAVGRMVGKKAPLRLLEAFREALKENNNIYLHYIGEGPLMQQVVSFIERNALSGHVTLYGAQENCKVRAMLQQADIFLQHSIVDPETGDEEGLPVAILEAMSYSLPIITTRHAGIPEAVVHGVNGYLSEEGDSETMGRNIAQLALDHDLRPVMGKASFNRFNENFTWEKEKAGLERLLLP